MVFVKSNVYNQLIAVSERVNEETCGFLFGAEKEDNFYIEDCLAVENKDIYNKRVRYFIAAEDYLNAESISKSRKTAILGVFHSHCNSAAEMSELDIKYSFPGFIYLILSLKNNRFDHLKVWQIDSNQDCKEIQNKII